MAFERELEWIFSVQETQGQPQIASFLSQSMSIHFPWTLNIHSNSLSNAILRIPAHFQREKLFVPPMGVVCTRAFYGVWAVADSNMRSIGTVYRVQRSIFMLPVNLYVGGAVRVKMSK